MKIDRAFIKKTRNERNLQLIIKNLCTVAAAVAELQKDISEIKGRLGIEQSDEILD